MPQRLSIKESISWSSVLPPAPPLNASALVSRSGARGFIAIHSTAFVPGAGAPLGTSPMNSAGRAVRLPRHELQMRSPVCRWCASCASSPEAIRPRALFRFRPRGVILGAFIDCRGCRTRMICRRSLRSLAMRRCPCCGTRGGRPFAWTAKGVFESCRSRRIRLDAIWRATVRCRARAIPADFAGASPCLCRLTSPTSSARAPSETCTAPMSTFRDRVGRGPTASARALAARSSRRSRS